MGRRRWNRPALGGRTAPSALNAQDIDVYVADHARMKLAPVAQRESYASVAAGTMAQNVYLHCASAGLATVIRARIDHHALAQAMGLEPDHQILLAQTVGYSGRPQSTARLRRTSSSLALPKATVLSDGISRLKPAACSKNLRARSLRSSTHNVT